MPGGSGMGVVPGGGGMGETPGPPMGFNPANNGAANLTGPAAMGTGTVTQDTTQAPIVTDDTMQNMAPRAAAIAQEIVRDNPGLSYMKALGLVARAFNEYLTREPGWESNPLAVVAARDLDPDLPEGRGEPLPPRAPERPHERSADSPGGQEWYQSHGEAPSELANAPVHAENTLWERMTGGHEAHPGGST